MRKSSLVALLCCLVTVRGAFQSPFSTGVLCVEIFISTAFTEYVIDKRSFSPLFLQSVLVRQASEWAVTQCLLLCISLLCVSRSVSGLALIGLIKSGPPFKVFSFILINETFFVNQGYEQFRQIVDLCSAFLPLGFV